MITTQNAGTRFKKNKDTRERISGGLAIALATERRPGEARKVNGSGRQGRRRIPTARALRVCGTELDE